MRLPLAALVLALALAVPAGALVPAALDAETRATTTTQIVRVPSTPTAPAAPAAAASAHGHDPDGPHVGRAPTPTPVMARNHGTMQFVCPAGNDVLGIPLPAAAQGDDPVVSGCPIRVYDTQFHFGNAEVVVNEARPNEAAFFSLHGGPMQDGPTNTSRGGRTHVTFTTSNPGAAWEDQPTDDGTQAGGFGDRASGAMDSEGNVYALYLWHQPYEDTWSSTLGFFKGPPTTVRGGMFEAYTDPFFLDPRESGGFFSEPHMVRVDAHVPERLVPAGEGNATNATGQGGEEANGEVAVPDPQNATPELLVAAWHELAADWTDTTTGLSGFIDFAWSDTGAENNWTRLNETQLIGPCRAASNPVTWEGKVYVGCVVERGYDERPRARVGHVDIWSLDLRTGETSLVDTTGLFGGRPLLAMNAEGYMAILVYRKTYTEAGNFTGLEADVGFSWYGQRWERNGDIGPNLRRLASDGLPLLDADVTGLVLTDDEPTVFLTYKELHDDPQDPTAINQDDPAAIIGNRLTDYNKFIVAYNPCEFPLAASQMELGSAVDSGNAEAYVQNPAMFNDVQDGLFVARDPGGGELVWFAVNDYGAMQFGAILAESVLGPQACFIPPAPPIIPVAAVPQALTLGNPYTWAAGVALGVPAAAMVLYLLTAKKRNPVAVAVEDR